MVNVNFEILQTYYNTNIPTTLLTNILNEITNKYDINIDMKTADARYPADIQHVINKTSNNSNIVFVYSPNNTAFNEILSIPGYEELKNVSLYLKLNLNHKVRVYSQQNREEKNPYIIILVNRKVSAEIILKLFACIPIFYKLDTEELFKKVFLAINEANCDALRTIYKENFANSENITTENLTKILQVTQKTDIQQKINDYTNKIQNSNKTIEALLQDIRNASSLLEEQQTKLEIYKYKLTQTTEIPKELLNIFKNPDIVDICIGSSPEIIHLHLQQPIRYYDTGIAERLIDNVDEYTKNILKKCFIEQTHQIWWYSFITINLKNKTITSSKAQYDANYKNFELKKELLYENSIANPHIMQYNCWGSNAGTIHHCLMQGDLAQAMLYALTATSSLALADNAVTSKLYAALRTTPAIKTNQNNFIKSTEL